MRNASGLALTDLRRCAAAGFSPGSLTGLKLWLLSESGVFSDAGVTPATDADPVRPWDDQSAGAHNESQGTSGKRPTFRTAVQNGRAAVRFDGVNDLLAAAFTLGQPCYWAMVGTIRSNGTYLMDGAVANSLALLSLSGTLIMHAGGGL